LVADLRDNVKFIEKIGRSQVMHNGQATQLLPQLKHKIENGNIVACIANVAPNPNIANVLHLDSINSCFPVTKSYQSHYIGGDFLPMYGEIKSWSPAGAYTCLMTRAVAKIQVQLGPSFSTVVSDFNVENVTYQVWWVTTSNFIQRKQDQAPNAVWEASSNPSWYTAHRNLLQKTGATETQTNVFIHEYQSSSFGRNREAFDKKTWSQIRIYILLTKRIGANQKWYRLEFYDHAKSEFIEVLRNHHYLFTINRVDSDGYNSTYEVQAFPGSNIEYTITVDDNALSITSNGQYAMVTSVDTVRIQSDVTDQAVTKYKAIYPPELTKPLGMPMTDTIFVDTKSIQPDDVELIIKSPKDTYWQDNPMITEDYQDLVITTAGKLKETVILFKYGNITHRLPVRRRPPQ
jgi:hypothetical protein